MGEVYDRYVDTAGNYHYTDVETGHHVIPNTAVGNFPPPRLIKTNADRIRAMSDEELCNEYFRILNHQLWNYTDSRLGLLGWLKEEAKRET